MLKGSNKCITGKILSAENRVPACRQTGLKSNCLIVRIAKNRTIHFAWKSLVLGLVINGAQR